MSKFFASLTHNFLAGLVGFAPVAIAAVQAGPQGGAAAYVQAHPVAGAIWTLASYALTMAVRDNLKNVQSFAASSGTTPPKG